MADVAFEATGKTPEEVFKSCAEATFEVMVDLTKIKPDYAVTFELTNKNLEKLLFEFIEELIFLKDAESVVFSKFTLNILPGYKLTCTAEGTEIKKIKETRTDVKAVTFHHFSLKKEQKGWKAIVVLDI